MGWDKGDTVNNVVLHDETDKAMDDDLVWIGHVGYSPQKASRMIAKLRKENTCLWIAVIFLGLVGLGAILHGAY